MKYLLLLTVFFPVFSFVSCSQDIPANEVPSVVINALKAKFPEATGIDWEKKQDLYEAEFDFGKTEFSVLIDSNGKLILHKQDIKKRDLPTNITSVLNSNYKKFRIDDVEKLEKDGITYYQAELKGNGKVARLVFSAEGREEKNIDYWD